MKLRLNVILIFIIAFLGYLYIFQNYSDINQIIIQPKNSNNNYNYQQTSSFKRWKNNNTSLSLRSSSTKSQSQPSLTFSFLSPFFSSHVSSSNISNDNISQNYQKLDWFDQLLVELKDQDLLTENVKSKEMVWRSLNITKFEKSRSETKEALIYLGWVAFWNMEHYAKNGGPAGEFIIWGDFVAGLSALGYKLTFVNKMIDLWIYLKYNPLQYDILITDYDGLGTAENIGHFPLYHCRYYLIDGFGTQSKFNIKRNLDLKRILTPYPFDGSNSPINIIVSILPKSLWLPLESYGVIWAKDPEYLEPYKKIIDYITNILHIQLVTTFRLGVEHPAGHQVLHHLNSNPRIIPKGFISRIEYLQLLSSSMFLIGFGKPLDGPTPLEAIAHGCVFINPSFNPPFVHKNKPTRFEYTSQHPFVEQNIHEPFSFTIDIKNETILSQIIEKIKQRHEQKLQLQLQIKELKEQLILTNTSIIRNNIEELEKKYIEKFTFIHSIHRPENYVKNIEEILKQTNEKNCLAQYSDFKNVNYKNYPKKHPGNKVFATFSEFVDDGCQQSSGCDSRWSHIEGSKELLDRFFNSTERLKVIRQSDYPQ